jgi:putative FmdB family regulatory protein
MPVYRYQCKECEEVFDIRHSMSEVAEICKDCKGELVRVFTAPGIKVPASGQKVGEMTVNHIEESRKELEEMKEQMKNGEF